MASSLRLHLQLQGTGSLRKRRAASLRGNVRTGTTDRCARDGKLEAAGLSRNRTLILPQGSKEAVGGAVGRVDSGSAPSPSRNGDRCEPRTAAVRRWPCDAAPPPVSAELRDLLRRVPLSAYQDSSSIRCSGRHDSPRTRSRPSRTRHPYYHITTLSLGGRLQLTTHAQRAGAHQCGL